MIHQGSFIVAVIAMIAALIISTPSFHSVLYALMSASILSCAWFDLHSRKYWRFYPLVFGSLLTSYWSTGL